MEHLNIDSLRNKFDALTQKITGNVDNLTLSQTKLDSSFPEGQFLIPGYSAPYRIDRTCHGRALMLFVREDIPSKLLLTEMRQLRYICGKISVVPIIPIGPLLIVTWIL